MLEFAHEFSCLLVLKSGLCLFLPLVYRSSSWREDHIERARGEIRKPSPSELSMLPDQEKIFMSLGAAVDGWSRLATAALSTSLHDGHWCRCVQYTLHASTPCPWCLVWVSKPSFGFLSSTSAIQCFLFTVLDYWTTLLPTSRGCESYGPPPSLCRGAAVV